MGNRSWLLAGAILLLGVACSSKSSDVLAPVPGPPPPAAIPDGDPPVITLINPLPGLPAVNDNLFKFSVTDGLSSNGATVSGVRPSSVAATYGTGINLPLTVSGSTYTGSLDGVPDGATSVYLSARDNAGNASGVYNIFTRKTHGPTYYITTTPPLAQFTTDTSLIFNLGGTVIDPYPGTAIFTLKTAGADSSCSTSDDVVPIVGTGAGQVSASSIDFTSAFRSSGAWSATITVHNPSADRTAGSLTNYCFNLTATDIATDGTGAPRPNSSSISWNVSVSWQATFGVVRGTVTRLGGAPLAGVVVTATRGANSLTATTASDGSYRLLLVSGSYSVSMACPGGGPQSSAVGLLPSSTITVPFACP